MNTYYVNKFYLKNAYESADYGIGCIGLFTNRDWCGEGNCCGWYSSEYYQNTTLLAYFRSIPYQYNPKDKRSAVGKCGKHFDKFPIGTDIWTIEFQAKDDEEAIKKFANLDFPDPAHWANRSK